MTHLPYSPYLTSAELVFFLKIKCALKREPFDDIQDMQCAVTNRPKDVPVQRIHRAFERWYDLCNRSRMQGEYFETVNKRNVSTILIFSIITTFTLLINSNILHHIFIKIYFELH